MQRRHPSPDCPLCGEKDHAEHFVYCSIVNKSPQYESVVQGHSHQANKKGCPDHLVNTIRQSMIGVHKSPRRQKEGVRQPYETQSRIGWQHFRKARIIKEWSQLKTEKAQDLDTGFRADLAKVILSWLLEKWRIRCSLVSDSSKTVEHARVLNDYRQMWERRE